MQPPKSEIITDPCQFIAIIARKIFPLDKWNFYESYRSIPDGKIIFNSKICRMYIQWSGWDYLVGNSISILYGRLHAPNNDNEITINNKKYYFWHRIEPALHFFDETNYQDAVNSLYTHKLLLSFRESELGNNLANARKQPEWLLTMHKLIWEKYGSNIELLFDLSKSDVWDKYRIYLSKIYDIKGRVETLSVPEDNIW